MFYFFSKPPAAKLSFIRRNYYKSKIENCLLFGFPFSQIYPPHLLSWPKTKYPEEKNEMEMANLRRIIYSLHIMFIKVNFEKYLQLKPSSVL